MLIDLRHRRVGAIPKFNRFEHYLVILALLHIRKHNTMLKPSSQYLLPGEEVPPSVQLNISCQTDIDGFWS
jgi:hypothetical protein